MTEVVIGLDVGTTAAKAVAFVLPADRVGGDDGRGYEGGGLGGRSVAAHRPPSDRAVRAGGDGDRAGSVAASASVPVTSSTPGPGRHEQDPTAVAEAAVEALARCVVDLGGAPVAAVAVSTAMHGLVGLDRNRAPLTPLVTWADARAGDEARALADGPRGGELHRTTGTPVHPMAPLAKVRWFTDHEPATAAAVDRWVGVKELVLDRLTGELVTEQSSASGTGLFDLATRAWSPVAVAAAGTTVDHLPPVLETTAVLALAADAADRVGLPPGTPVVVGAADGPLANLGVGAVEAGVAGLSVGTSAAVRTVVTRPGVDDAGGLFCYVLTGDRWSDAEDRWVAGGALSNGGAVVTWAAGALGFADEAALLEAAATVAPGSDGLALVPFLVAERAPLWRDARPAAWVGLRADHGRAHLARAAVEGVAVQVAELVDRVAARHPLRAVRATGGVFAEPLWREVVAAAVAQPVTMTSAAAGTALGAARLATIALGRAEDLDAAVALVPDADGVAAESVTVDPVVRAAARATRATVADQLTGAAHLTRR